MDGDATHELISPFVVEENKNKNPWILFVIIMPPLDITPPMQQIYFSIGNCIYHKISNIRHIKSQNLNVYCLVLQLSLQSIEVGC